MTTIKLPCFDITVTLGPTDPETPAAFLGGKISSSLKDGDGEPTPEYDNAIDGIESLILAHATAGIDITHPAYVEGVETAVSAAMNNLT